jgi:ring-1,2-phenylacetyl-CoA epoxidase subunit PaaE
MSRFNKLRVTEVKRETADTVSVSFDVPSDLRSEYAFRHGQYLTLKKDISGEDVRRSYSICSGPGEDLRVAVKEVEGGLFSGFANRELKAGDELEVMTPMGNFTAPIHPDKAKQYLLIAAGSGITPMMSIIKTVLNEEPDSELTLIYGNRFFHSIVFRDELEDLKDRHLGRLRIFHVLSGEANEVDLFAGRIDEEKLRRFFATFLKADSPDEVFICGPAPMIETATESLKNLGISAEKIRFELFTSPKGSLWKERRPEVAEELKGKSSKVAVTLYGQQWELEVPFSETILDAAIAKGLDLPFSCKGGMCCTCRAKVNDGKVDMLVNYALEPGEVEDGYVLTCQSRPASDAVAVNFDE